MIMLEMLVLKTCAYIRSFTTKAVRVAIFNLGWGQLVKAAYFQDMSACD